MSRTGYDMAKADTRPLQGSRPSIFTSASSQRICVSVSSLTNSSSTLSSTASASFRRSFCDRLGEQTSSSNGRKKAKRCTFTMTYGRCQLLFHIALLGTHKRRGAQVQLGDERALLHKNAVSLLTTEIAVALHHAIVLALCGNVGRSRVVGKLRERMPWQPTADRRTRRSGEATALKRR